MALEILAIYLLVINVVTLALYGIDKRKAIKHKWRIKEATLLGFTFVGGSVGAFLGMQLFHHKTQKWYFKYGVPVMFIFHAIVVYLAGIKMM